MGKSSHRKHVREEDDESDYEPSESGSEVSEPPVKVQTAHKKRKKAKKDKKPVLDTVPDEPEEPEEPEASLPVTMTDEEMVEAAASAERVVQRQKEREQGKDPNHPDYTMKHTTDEKIQDFVRERASDVAEDSARLGLQPPATAAEIKTATEQLEQEERFKGMSEFERMRLHQRAQPTAFANFSKEDLKRIKVRAKYWSNGTKSGHNLEALISQDTGVGMRDVQLCVTGPVAPFTFVTFMPCGNFKGTCGEHIKNPAKTLGKAEFYFQQSCKAFDPANAVSVGDDAPGVMYDRDSAACADFLRGDLRDEIINAILTPRDPKLADELAKVKTNFTNVLVNNGVAMTEIGDDDLKARAKRELRSGHAAKCAALPSDEQEKRVAKVRELMKFDKATAMLKQEEFSRTNYQPGTGYIESKRGAFFAYGDVAYKKFVEKKNRLSDAVEASDFYKNLWEKKHAMVNPIRVYRADDMSHPVPLDEQKDVVVPGALGYVIYRVVPMVPKTKNSLNGLGISLEPQTIVICGYDSAFAKSERYDAFQAPPAASSGTDGGSGVAALPPIKKLELPTPQTEPQDANELLANVLHAAAIGEQEEANDAANNAQ